MVKYRKGLHGRGRKTNRNGIIGIISIVMFFLAALLFGFLAVSEDSESDRNPNEVSNRTR